MWHSPLTVEPTIIRPLHRRVYLRLFAQQIVRWVGLSILVQAEGGGAQPQVKARPQSSLHGTALICYYCTFVLRLRPSLHGGARTRFSLRETLRFRHGSHSAGMWLLPQTLRLCGLCVKIAWRSNFAVRCKITPPDCYKSFHISKRRHNSCQAREGGKKTNIIHKPRMTSSIATTSSDTMIASS